MTTTANKGAIIQVRVNSRVKKDAQKTLQRMGLDISTAVNMLLHQVVLTQTMPFESRTINGFTREQEKEYIEGTKHAIERGKRYKNAADLLADID